MDRPRQMFTRYRCFNNLEKPILGAIKLTLISRNWVAKDNQIFVVSTQTVSLLGRDVLGKLGVTLLQPQGMSINHIVSDTPIQTRIIKKFPNLCTRQGSSKNHIAKSTIKQNKQPFQHKQRRIPLDLHEKVDKKIRHFYESKQIIKLEKSSDNVFISPVDITVKHEKFIKIALDSELLNDAIEWKKYQM